jgi:hypothetical protein
MSGVISTVLICIVGGYLAFWFVLGTGIARLDGWAALVRRFPVRRPPDGKRFTMQSGKIGWADYNGCLRIIVADEGLYLAMWPRFMFGHPPMLLPWPELNVLKVQDKWWGRYLSLAVGNPVVARIRLPLKIVEHFQNRPAEQSDTTASLAASEQADNP